MNALEQPVEELRTRFRVYDLQDKKYIKDVIFYLNNNGTLYILDQENSMRALPLDRFIIENCYLNHGNGVSIMNFIFLAGQLLGEMTGEKKRELEQKLGSDVVASLIEALKKVADAMKG